MSRIGERPIEVPAGVTLAIEDGIVRVKGAKGELIVTLPPGVTVSQEGATVNVVRRDDTRESRSMHGLGRSLVANAVAGVTQGYSRTLEIEGVGYRAQVQGRLLTMSVGYSSPVEYTPPEGVTVVVEGNTTIVVSGADKQKVGDAAARIRGFYPAEPYKGKGIKYKGEQIRRKVGKTVA